MVLNLNLTHVFWDLSQLLEEEEVEVPVSKEPPKEANKMEMDEASSDATPSSTDADVNMQDAKEPADASAAENGVPESGDKPVQMETDTKVYCYFHVKGSLFCL